MRHSEPTAASCASDMKLALLALAAVGFCGCKDPNHDKVDGPDDTQGDGLVLEPEVLWSEIVPNVATVRFSTSEPTTCAVVYGPPGDLSLRRAASSEPSTSHEAVLVGLLPGSLAELAVEVASEDGTLTSSVIPLKVGTLPVGAPNVELAVHDTTQAFDGFTVVPIRKGDDAWVSVFDAEARLIWTYLTTSPVHTIALAPDGSGLYFNRIPQKDEVEEVIGEELVHIAWDGQLLWSSMVRASHHDFVVLDDEHYAFLGYSTLVIDEGLESERTMQGDSIIEFDRDGDSSVIWNIFDHIEPDLALTTNPEPDKQGRIDWSHGNYLSLDRSQGLYYVSLRHLDAIIAVEAGTGAQRWALSNTWGDLVSSDGEPLLAWPHSAEVSPDGLHVFNQHYDSDSDACSEAVILSLDPEAGTAEEVWSYQNAECSKVRYLGNTQVLPNGNVLVDFSQTGILDEVTPDGTVVYRLVTSIGSEFAYA